MIDFDVLNQFVREQVYDMLIDLGMISDACDTCDHPRYCHHVDPYGKAVCGSCEVGTHNWEPQKKIASPLP